MDKISSPDPPPDQDTRSGSGYGNDQTATFGSPDGAHIGTRPMERVMNVYPVLEPELDAIGRLTIQTTVWFSVTGILASAGFTLYLESVLSPEASPEGVVLLAAGPWACGILGVVTAILGGHSWIERRQYIDRIKRESKQRAIVVAEEETTTM